MPTMTAFSAMTRRALPAASIALAAVLGGCDLKVTNPGPLLDENLNTPSAIPALVNGMGGDLSNAIGNYLTRGSLAALELRHSGNFAAERKFAVGDIAPEDVNGDWARMHTARYVAEAGLERMKTVLGTGFETNVSTPRAYLYAGFANRFLGENVCNAVYDGGPALPGDTAAVTLIVVSVSSMAFYLVVFLAAPMLHHLPQAAWFGLALGGGACLAYRSPRLLEFLFTAQLFYFGIVWLAHPLVHAVTFDVSAVVAAAALLTGFADWAGRACWWGAVSRE